MRSRFFSAKYDALTPYTPGEQPAGVEKYLKLNTNESPFPPSPAALEYAAEHTRSLKLYPDPECRELRALVAASLGAAAGVRPSEVLLTNGSDEILNFAFMAFCDASHPAVFPDITYGFYAVFSELNGIPYSTLPLREDFSVDVEAYVGLGKTIFLANPNAPTGLVLSPAEIERIVAGNPDNVVVVDEAYIDFGGQSCVPLIHRYDNLLVTRTFSKSCSMAGARLGFGVGSEALIADLNTIKYSTNPYNINSMTMAMGIGTLLNADYVRRNCAAIAAVRDATAATLRQRGFEVTPSAANFLFARSGAMEGGALYRALREKGVLVRHFDEARISDYNRITVGTEAQMDALLGALEEILGGAV